MNTTPDAAKDATARSEQRDTKTFTLRMPLELHELVERAARSVNASLNQFITDAAVAMARKQVDDPAAAMAPAIPIAILVDLDSFSGRSSINVDAIEGLAATLGRPMLKASYSTTAAASELPSLRQTLVSRYFNHSEHPSRDALRIRVAADCLDIVAAGHASAIILVTGDEEFGALSVLLGQRGARVLGVGMRTLGTTSPVFIKTFESFRFLEHLERPPASDELKKLRSECAALLVETAFRLESRGAKPVGAALIPFIRDRRPDMSLELLEMRTWRELAEVAKDEGLLTAVEASGADFLLRLSELGMKRSRELSKATDAQNAQRGEIDSVSASINNIIGTELPDAGTRFVIFNTAQWVLNEDASHDGLSLIDLSFRVVAKLGSTSVLQNTVYRLLMGLYRCGAFETVPNPANEYDPTIIRSRIPVMQYDDAFVLNLMRVRNKFPLNANPSTLSQVIYGVRTYAAKIEAMTRISAEPRYSGRSSLTEALAHIASGA